MRIQRNLIKLNKHFETKEEAMRREYAIKQLTRKQKLNLMEF